MSPHLPRFGAATVRLRRLLARHPWLYWSLIVAAAALTASVVAGHVGALRAERAEWGERRTVWVATRPVAVGEQFAAAIEQTEFPVALVPPSAITDRPARAARRAISVGEVIVDGDVSPTDGPLARVPADLVAVPVAERRPSGAAVGEHVLVLADGMSVASATVVSAAADLTLLAVDPDQAALVALADRDGLTLARIP